MKTGIMDCLFCAIVDESVEASIAFEDDKALVILDVRPVSSGHVLVIPREHYVAISDLPQSLFVHLARIAHMFAANLAKVSPAAEGMNILMSEGTVASQSVFHAHMHIIPRVMGDSMVLTSDDPVANRENLDAMADEWRKAIAGGLLGMGGADANGAGEAS